MLKSLTIALSLLFIISQNVNISEIFAQEEISCNVVEYNEYCKEYTAENYTGKRYQCVEFDSQIICKDEINGSISKWGISSKIAWPEPITSTIKEHKIVPEWVKNNAKWWSEGAIDNESFLKGIEYLVNEKILIVSKNVNNQQNQNNSEIPSWVKNNAKWWSDGAIDNESFLKGIEYLVNNGTIEIKNNSKNSEKDKTSGLDYQNSIPKVTNKSSLTNNDIRKYFISENEINEIIENGGYYEVQTELGSGDFEEIYNKTNAEYDWEFVTFQSIFDDIKIGYAKTDTSTSEQIKNLLLKPSSEPSHYIKTSKVGKNFECIWKYVDLYESEYNLAIKIAKDNNMPLDEVEVDNPKELLSQNWIDDNLVCITKDRIFAISMEEGVNERIHLFEIMDRIIGKYYAENNQKMTFSSKETITGGRTIAPNIPYSEYLVGAISVCKKTERQGLSWEGIFINMHFDPDGKKINAVVRMEFLDSEGKLLAHESRKIQGLEYKDSIVMSFQVRQNNIENFDKCTFTILELEEKY